MPNALYSIHYLMVETWNILKFMNVKLQEIYRMPYQRTWFMKFCARINIVPLKLFQNRIYVVVVQQIQIAYSLKMCKTLGILTEKDRQE